jgi:hypothetical protein
LRKEHFLRYALEKEEFEDAQVDPSTSSRNAISPKVRKMNEASDSSGLTLT